MTDQPISAGPGDTLTVLKSVTFGGYVRARGDRIHLDQAMVDGTKDVNGVSFLDDLSEATQVRRWGQAVFVLGSDDVEPWTYGDPTWELARETSRRAAWAQTDPEQRAAALAAVEARYGPPLTTSVVHNAAADPSIKLAEQQEAARRLAGVRQVSSYAPERRVNP